MRLFVTAHFKEGEPLIAALELRRFPLLDGMAIFRNENNFLLVCGEGIDNALTQTTAVLAILRDQITEVVNMSVAGSVHSELKVGSIYEIRHVYAAHDSLSTEFRSFACTHATGAVDCVSTRSRILNDQDALKLRPIAKLVDRELWGIAWAAQMLNTPVRSFKIVSDIAGSATSCERVRQDHDELLENLWSHVRTVLDGTAAKLGNSNLERSEVLSIAGVHFTHAMSSRAQALIHAIKLRLNIDPLENLRVKVAEFSSQYKTPKERGRAIIHWLESVAEPELAHVQNSVNEWSKGISTNSVRFTFPTNLEPCLLQINGVIRNDEDRLQLAESLMSFTMNDAHAVASGESLGTSLQ